MGAWTPILISTIPSMWGVVSYDAAVSEDGFYIQS